jgi:hypothetical protein
MSAFDELLKELELLQKSLPQNEGDIDPVDDEDDEKIKDAASDDMVDTDETEDNGDDDDGEYSDDELPMGKSIRVKLESGEEIEAYDGSEMIKSIHNDVGSAKVAMASAVQLIKDLSSRVASQGEMIKSLQNNLSAVSDKGRGRKATLSVHEKPLSSNLQKSEGISPTEFMTKALAAQRAGKLTGYDISVAESCLGRGMAVPGHIVSRVTSE